MTRRDAYEGPAGWAGTCPATGKRIWETKALAKRGAKQQGGRHGGHMNAYRCPSGADHWHLGHLPVSVIRGASDRAAIAPPVPRPSRQGRAA